MIIIEGIDGTGKSTVSSYLRDMGYVIHHLQFSEKNEEGFINLLKQDNDHFVLDRAFMTEVVYGPVLRNGSRINNEQLNSLIDLYSSKKVKIIYLKALKKDLLLRRKDDKEDYEMLIKHYEQLSNLYDNVVDLVSKKIETHIIDTSKCNMDKMKEFVKRIVK